MTTESRTSSNVAIAGFLAAGALLLAAGFFGPSLRRSPAAEVPPLRILAPADGDAVENPVTLTFVTTTGLALTPGGWNAGELHLHLMVDDVEFMPAAADITASGDSVFTWRMPHLEAGRRRIYMTWAGRHHGNLAGDADTVTVHVRP